MFAHKYIPVAAIAVLLAACTLPAALRHAGQAGAPERPPSGARVYRIDGAQSELRVLVYRAGALAQFGHDHVLVNRALNGWVAVTPPATAVAFLVSVPAAAFLVDDAEARRSEGADFAEAVSEEAKAGTRQHMLGAAVLDAARFPSIVVHGARIAGSAPTVTATATIRIAGHVATIAIPCRVDLGPRRLSVSADFGLRQTALGLTPYSALLGALSVRDQMRVKVKIVAVTGQ